MEKEFVLYQEALQLKELGFDEECFGQFIDDGKKFHWFKPNMTMVELHNIRGFEHRSHTNSMCCVGSQCTAPLYQQAFKWFIDNYKLRYKIEPTIGNKLELFILDGISWVYIGSYNNDEEAKLFCIRKLIEIVK
jgi:hypothetical protein